MIMSIALIPTEWRERKKSPWAKVRYAHLTGSPSSSLADSSAPALSWGRISHDRAWRSGRRGQARVQVAHERAARGEHGKEGVSGSSPEEGL
jgi:hypothetical protein